MSISYKKVNSMIELEVDSNKELNDEQKELLKNICKHIYTLEAGLDAKSRTQLLSDIKGKISLEASSF